MPTDITAPTAPAHGRLNMAESLDSFYMDEARNYKRSVGVYHPSSLSPSACLRALYYDRIGATPERTNHVSELKLFSLGHYIHDGLQATLKKIWGDDFQPEVFVRYEPLHIEGHADGVVYGWVVEIKSIGDASFKTLVRPKTEHLWQVHCYMKALDLPRAQMLYINRNTGDTRLFRVTFDEVVWERITALIATVEGFVDIHEPPSGVDKPYTCRGCKFLRTCEPPCLAKTRS